MKDPFELKYQYLIKKREEVGLKNFKDPKAFMKYLNMNNMSRAALTSTIQGRNQKYW